MGLVLNRVYENQDKVTQVLLMLELSYTKSGVRLLKTGFLLSPTRLGGPSLPCIGQQVLCPYLILDPKILSKFETWNRRSKFCSTFKISSNTWRDKELLIESFLKGGSNS